MNAYPKICFSVKFNQKELNSGYKEFEDLIASHDCFVNVKHSDEFPGEFFGEYFFADFEVEGSPLNLCSVLSDDKIESCLIKTL